MRGQAGVAFALLTALSGSGCKPEAVEIHVSPSLAHKPAEVARRIRETYDERFFELERQYQSHYAVRMYRATGEPQRLEAVAYDLRLRVEQFVKHVDSLAVPGYIEGVSRGILATKPTLTETQRNRRDLFDVRPEHVFHRRVLFTAHKIRDYGVHEGLLKDSYEAACDHLRSVDYRSFLLDPEVIRPYAAQTSNLVFWLKRLEVVDLEAEYSEVFRKLFMRGNDSRLRAADYMNKLYGLTHFIIGASHYYQRFVPPEEFAWVLDYFDRHILEILSWSKPDIIAEIGLCFKLCGLGDHRVLEMAKQYLIASFEPDLGFIPSGLEAVDFNTSEHRNAVAYLVLSDLDELYVGPRLTDADLGYFSSEDLRPRPKTASAAVP